jgi:hypothetical protein
MLSLCVFTLLTKYVLVRGSSMFVALIDFQKAFPSVNRALLIAKLESLGVSARFQRCLVSIFADNTFAVRSGDKVTREFPVITGLREGSVLSPLLFVIFVSDMCSQVISPFGNHEYWRRDPSLNRVPIPGLMYADDLVLFCLSADLLRERLRRLSIYADRNQLTVNVLKCEVVVFGGGHSSVTFRYKKKVIPLRRSCKYLGVWLDGDMSGRSLADAVHQKFVAGVPVFFSLCRRLRLGRIDLVSRLANAMVFSLLYGGEFLGRLDVVRKCEAAWWRGVQGFYGLPPGVSSVFIRLLFPRVSLINRVTAAKFGLLFRGSQPLSTLFPEAIVCDRGVLFSNHCKGFSQILKEWCEQLGFMDFFFPSERSEIRSMLQASLSTKLDEDWSQFVSMPSTAFAATLLSDRQSLYSLVLFASRYSSLGVRAVVLALSGTLSLSYCKSRLCPHCGIKFSCEHFMCCEALGPSLVDTFSRFVEDKDFHGAAVLLLSRFQVFLHSIRGEFSSEEEFLFDALCEPVDESEDVDASVPVLFSRS